MTGANAKAGAARTAENAAPARPRLSAIGRLEDRRQVRRVRVVRALFVVGLLTWTSLAGWWATYFYRSTQAVRDAKLQMYAAIEMLYARELDPRHLTLVGAPDLFQLVPLPLDEDARAFPFVEVPLAETPAERSAHPPTHAIVVHPGERARLHHDSARKMWMLAGEGTLLVGLLFVCLVALYRMLVSEWRLNRQTEGFVHAVTHELKSPLAGLRALLQSFQKLELTAAERGTYVEMGLAEVARLDQLVGNILLSTRLEADAFTPRLETIDLDAVLARLAGRRQLRFQERGGHLLVEGDGGTVQADPEALETILENLVDNGLKYSPGVPEVRLRTKRVGGRVLLSVEDRGIGLTRAESARVFEKFYRTPDGEVQAAKGTGLGLFIARGLARACGGELRVESAGRGTGARFELELGG
jgi:two-component system sensor histidine kinase CiaH